MAENLIISATKASSRQNTILFATLSITIKWERINILAHKPGGLNA